MKPEAMKIRPGSFRSFLDVKPHLPSTISSAITGGRDAGAVVGNSTLTVKRTDNESGTGYEMSFSIK